MKHIINLSVVVLLGMFAISCQQQSAVKETQPAPAQPQPAVEKVYGSCKLSPKGGSYATMTKDECETRGGIFRG